MPPKIIKFLTNHPTQNLVTHNFVRATSISTTLIPHRSFYSTTPSRQTQSSDSPATPAPPSQLPVDPTTTEAVIRCQVTKDRDLELERKCAVNGLWRVTMEVTKECFGTSPNTKFACVNPAEESFLGSVERMRSEIAEARKDSNKKFAEMQKESDKRFEEMQKESDKRCKESDKRFNESEKMINECEKMFKESDKSCKEMWKELEKLKLTTRPLEPVAIAIRRRFFSLYRRSISQASLGGAATIPTGIIAGNHDDLVTDTTLITRDNITDTAMYRRLYGISPQRAQAYLGMYPTTGAIIIIYARL
ncbi:hypothetical protein L873DRAFT_980755 [Choiromyces venosus 120613-1]|uniref:Uncharacterized protein n=1 Tax=Choiromyces venosus 120613-1 TaxID=1336337 RepID=A0A3N4JLC3_9PEZI|nr:hypothetical protein L873DRAFT_980755 [Choiromyces venosus 120613-1]